MLKNKIKKILIIAGVILGLGFIFSYKSKPIQQIPNTTIEYKDTKVNLGQEQKNQYNTDTEQVKVTKENIKQEKQASKRERVY